MNAWSDASLIDCCVQFLLKYLKYQAAPKSETASSKSFSCFEVIPVSPLAPSATTSWPAMTSFTTAAQLWAGEGATTTPTTPNPSITGELVVYELRLILGSLHYIFLFWHHGGFCWENSFVYFGSPQSSRSIEVEEIGEPRTIFRMSASGGGSRTTPTYNIPQELQVGECAQRICLAPFTYCGKWFSLSASTFPFQDVLLDFTVQFLIEQGCRCQKSYPSSLPSPMKAEDLVILH